MDPDLDTCRDLADCWEDHRRERGQVDLELEAWRRAEGRCQGCGWRDGHHPTCPNREAA